MHQHLIPMMQLFKWRSVLCNMCGAVELVCFHRRTGIQIKEQSMSDRTDLQICINIRLLVSKHIYRNNIACSGFVLKVLANKIIICCLFADCLRRSNYRSCFIFSSFSMRFVGLLMKFGKCKCKVQCC